MLIIAQAKRYAFYLFCLLLFVLSAATCCLFCLLLLLILRWRPNLTLCFFFLQIAADGSTPKSCGSGQQLVAPLSQGLKKEWDRIIALWFAKSNRPCSMGETDAWFKKVMSTVTYGRYTPPVEDTVDHLLKEMKADGVVIVRKKIYKYQKFDSSQNLDYVQRDLEPSIALDIWGEGGKSILGLLVYFIDEYFQMNELLLMALPFSNVAHNGVQIEKAIKQCLSSYGIGTYDENAKCPMTGRALMQDTVGECVHGATSDEVCKPA